MDADQADETATEERFDEPGADRMPTPEEEAAAERAATRVDLDEVASHHDEMVERGAGIRGEGEIDAVETDG